jgi:7-carboxy-7-deazaguanine synthase
LPPVPVTPKKFRVSEIFGPTIQGEGAIIGAKTHFIRLGGCDYRCKWCDSMYAVDEHEVAKLPQMTIPEIVKDVLDLPEAPWVTLSGGNPALFDLGGLVSNLHYAGMKVAIETQGTVWKDWIASCDLVTVSPKPPSSGNITEDYTVHKFVNQWHLAAKHRPKELVLKIVVFDDKDFEYAKMILSQFPEFERWMQVGNPLYAPGQGGMAQTHLLLARLRWLCDKVTGDEEIGDIRVTPQMHTLMWGNARAT